MNNVKAGDTVVSMTSTKNGLVRGERYEVISRSDENDGSGTWSTFVLRHIPSGREIHQMFQIRLTVQDSAYFQIT